MGCLLTRSGTYRPTSAKRRTVTKAAKLKRDFPQKRGVNPEVGAESSMLSARHPLLPATTCLGRMHRAW